MARIRSSRLLSVVMVYSQIVRANSEWRIGRTAAPDSIRPISPPRDDFADRAGVVGGEEQPTIGNRDDGACPTGVEGNRIFTDQFAVRRHAADLVGKILGEPEIAVGCHRDAA